MTTVQSNQRDVLVLLRLVDNRLCADCDAPLGETVISGSRTFGTWVCQRCAEVHHRCGWNSNLKLAMDEWTEDEIQRMRKAGNNTRVNKIYERFIPPGWRKCRPDSSYDDRVLWTQAKYDCKMFVLPQRSLVKDSYSSKQAPSTLPVRIVDFFLIVTPGPCKLLARNLNDVSPESLVFEPVISSCYPSTDFYKDMQIPDNIGPFAFPTGLHLSSVEKTPHFFTFVVTDVHNIKVYGATLHVYELVEPEELSTMLGIPVNSPQFPRWPLVFAAKALTVISHYGFFNLYREFLEQLYRISLSSSPIPIERYIVNFVHEVPLPPQGQIEVNFALADRTICISRPPKNRLPMVDFSYRPLFTCLTVEHILVVFAALCTERKVCICSENIALLTPVQEALLSFLFPLVWQGVYIPIVPDHMDSVLDARAPILVGLHAAFLHNPAELNRRRGILFVDLDSDKLIMCSPPVLPLPTKPEGKLRARLLQFGQCIHKKKNLSTVGIAFPRREHLTPITTFVLEEGVTKQRNLDGSSAPSSLSVKRSPQQPTSIAHYYMCSKSSVPSQSLLNPNNNFDSNDSFDAAEIRGSFLRFFAAVLKDYRRHLVIDRSGLSSDTASEVASSTWSSSSRPFEISSIISKPDPFITALHETQMFERLSEERVERPYQPEIKFFDESILEKLNRSKVQLMRSRPALPFLTDNSDEISETYTPPPPSGWGVPPDQNYSYLKFPLLKPENFGPVRRAKPLVRSVEVLRARKVLNDDVVQIFSSRRPEEEAGSNPNTHHNHSMPTLRLEDLLTSAKLSFQRFERSLSVFQCYRRMRRARVGFLRLRRSIIRIQRMWRGVLWRRLQSLFSAKERALVSRIQALVRGFMCRRRYARRRWKLRILQMFGRAAAKKCRSMLLNRAATRIQAEFRCFLIYKEFQLKRDCVAIIQGVVRGRRTRKVVARSMAKWMEELRVQMFELWKLEHTPLIYRSKFWNYSRGERFLNLGLHEEELKRLWLSLDLGRHISACKSFHEEFYVVHSSLYSLKMSTISTSSPKQRDEELHERKEIYKRLKYSTTKATRDSYFGLFGSDLLYSKKRKQALSELVWEHFDQADVSAQVVLFGVKSDRAEWLYSKQSVRIQNAVVATVQACLVSIQRRKSKFSTLSTKARQPLHRIAVESPNQRSLTTDSLVESPSGSSRLRLHGDRHVSLCSSAS